MPAPQRTNPPLGTSRLALFVFLAILATAFKVFLAGLGHNFDVESWAIFADLIHDGKNIYAETYRNPYGPIWAYLCAGTSYVQAHVFESDTIEGFHRLLAFQLSLVDIGIAFFIARRYSFAAGALFLLNPVSLLVSGFHTQFGNLAVLLALICCGLLDKEDETPTPRYVLAMALLGLSLVFKHILIFLPLWFFFQPNVTRPKRLLSLVPFAVFAGSFLPFIRDERALEGVIEHVLLYESFHLDGFFPRLVDTVIPLRMIEALLSWVPVFSGFKFVWAAAMMLTGLAVRDKSYVEQLLVYLAAMVVFSSAAADQYLAIPLVTCAVYWRHFTAWWFVSLSAVFLSASAANVGMLPALSGYAEGVRALGIDRSHPVAALFVFLALYFFARGTRLAPSDGRNDRIHELRDPDQQHAAEEEQPAEA